MSINLKASADCKWDQLSLGEIMLRLDPGESRIHTAREFKVWEGGGEYNVARGLRRCFAQRTAVVTSLPDNPVGRLLEDLILQGGVDARHIKWLPYDGIGRESRVGLNFTEKGFGIRGAIGCSDRAYSAAGKLKPGDINWQQIFGEEGVRWFHCGGIYAGLSETTPDLIIEAMRTAKANGTIVSYDLNYRASLWQTNGGADKAKKINREIANHVDVMIGNEEDFTLALGFTVAGLDANRAKLDPVNFKKMISEVTTVFPNFQVIATTLRNVKSANRNDWSAILYHEGEFYQAIERNDLEIYDRVGGGDSFASGLIYGFLSGKEAQECVEYGAAHGALAMTTPGDTTMASLQEVENLIQGGCARVKR